jgi:TonB family protein
MSCFGIHFFDNPTPSTKEAVLTVNLVSSPIGQIENNRFSSSAPKPENFQVKNPINRSNVIFSEASSFSNTETTQRRDEDSPVQPMVFTPTSIVLDKEQSHSIEPHKRKWTNEDDQENASPIEKLKPHRPLQSSQFFGELKEENVRSLSFPRLDAAPKVDRAIFKGEAEKGSLSGAESVNHEKPLGKSFYSWFHYLREVQERIENLKKYPWLARMKGQEGSTRLGFKITHSGEPREIHLLKSSGWEVLDEESLNIVRRVGRFPVPPQNWKEDVQVEVPMVFQMDSSGSPR